jgi:ADP-ribose pyrophosphatase YjhB (NUDIX family)
MIDIDIKCNEGKFKLRTTGIIISDNKLLVQKAKKFDSYVLPGGHIELGELSKEAIIREIKEETGLDVKINHLVCINENIYRKNDTLAHEINYYYNLEPVEKIETKEFIIVENDKGVIKEQKFSWIDLDKLIENKVMPADIIKIIEKDINIKNLIIETDER